MKHFVSYRFPSLGHIAASQRAGGNTALGWNGEPFGLHTPSGTEAEFREGRAAGWAEGQREGHAAGHAEGLAQGAEAARQALLGTLDGLAKPVDAVLKGLKGLKTDYQSALRKEMVELVAKLAREVIRAELTMQPAQLLTLVDETLATLPPTRDEIEVHLNPDDLKRIVAVDPKRAKRWSLLADARLKPGECRVKAGDLEVDAGCEQRLAACVEQLGKSLEATAQAEGQAA